MSLQTACETIVVCTGAIHIIHQQVVGDTLAQVAKLNFDEKEAKRNKEWVDTRKKMHGTILAP